MRLDIKFHKDEERDEKLKRAQAFAVELRAVECEWHGKGAEVRVAPGDAGDLAWSVKNACCDEFKQALEKAILDATPRL